ncbi:MAG TPA: MBOAT family O-acyltransferase [Mycobacteriales bacterium]|nr:MBOAT family O-acyltransferase [Mycobacteriales bacterium]
MLDFDSFQFFANLFVVLVVVVPVYRLVRNVLARRLLLGLTGVYLLFLVAPRLALFYLVFWLLIWVAQQVVALSAERKHGTAVFVVSMVAVLAPMVIWKIFTRDFVIDFNLWGNGAVLALNRDVGGIDLAREIILPLGLSFSTFRGLDLLIKTYLGAFDRLRADEVFFYGFFPPVQLIGPVIQYTEIREAVRPGRTELRQDLREGLLLVMSGLFKVFVISYALQSSSQMFTYYRSNSTPVLWWELLLFALYFFFNFAGYSDMAVGAARLLGFDIMRNFDWPYTKTNPQSFWNSWHMSLTHFFQRNVFVPFGGMRQNTQYRAIFLTIMAIALWHDISIPLVVFGLYHAAGLIGHRYLKGKRPPREDEPLLLRVPKVVALVAFFAFSLPLMVIQANQIVPVYSALVGVR